MPKKLDLKGKRVGMLEVLKESSRNRQGSITWLCKCDCGNEKTYSSYHLTRKDNPVKSCGCYRKTFKGKNHPQWNGHEDISGNWWYNHVLRERTQKARTRVPVTIDIKYAWELFVKQEKRCRLSGVPLVISGTNRYNTASIDRIDSSKGYEEGNIQWVHKDINFMKRTYSQEYFIELCKRVANNEIV